MTAKMRNMGEACTAANRFLVHRSVADAFADQLAERMAALHVGRGTEDGVQVGPLIDAKGREKVAELVDDAVSRGGAGPGRRRGPRRAGLLLPAHRARRRAGGRAPVPGGDLRPGRADHVVDDDDEAVAAANDTEFGLVSYLYTENMNRALRVGERAGGGHGRPQHRAGVSNPAAPFGGIKQSGLGREGGAVGIEEYLETKYVAVGLR